VQERERWPEESLCVEERLGGGRSCVYWGTQFVKKDDEWGREGVSDSRGGKRKEATA